MVTVTFTELRPIEDNLPYHTRIEEFRYEVEAVAYRVLESMYSPINSDEALVTVMVGIDPTYIAVVVEAKRR